MAGNTLRGCTLISVCMAFPAFQFLVFSFQRKSCVIVVERYVAPPLWRVTGSTGCAKLTIMIVILGVAGITGRGCALISICMARLALDIFMLPCQREGRIIVIEGYILPPRGFMTGATIGPKLATVRIVRGMAGITILGRASISIVHVTGFACYLCVQASQRKRGIAMIERDILPAGRLMARGAIRAELTCVLIIRGMTGIAVLRYALQDAIYVTRRALHVRVTAT